MSTWERARARYVIWNIVSINHFFDTYYTGKYTLVMVFEKGLTGIICKALQYAASEAALMVDSLTNLLDPVKKPSVNLFAILSALAVALCFLGVRN